MPRYFFNVHDGEYLPDEDGTELVDIYSAQAEAIKLCGSLVRELGVKFWDHGEWKLEVCGADRRLLFTLTLTAAEHGLAAHQTAVLAPSR